MGGGLREMEWKGWFGCMDGRFTYMCDSDRGRERATCPLFQEGERSDIRREAGRKCDRH